MSHRPAQIADVIRHAIAPMLLTEIEHPANSITSIVAVKVTPDLKHAIVWLAITPPEAVGVVYGRIRDAAKHLRFLLADHLHLPVMPDLRFRVDQSGGAVDEINLLLNQIERERSVDPSEPE